MDYSVEALVIGAGVIGLAVARSLAIAGREVLLIDRETAIGTQTSSRNSEVIHSGIYYPPGTLKARLCVAGRAALYHYCGAHGVGTQRLGKLIVATTDGEVAKLTALKVNAEANGVTDLLWLSGAEVQDLEPALKCHAALLSPSTGIIDSHAFMLSLLAEAEGHGATLSLRTAFVSAQRTSETFEVRLRPEEGEHVTLACRVIVNCAGHGAHDAAAAVESYERQYLPPRFLARGTYCGVSGASPFRRLIYPVPVAGALGIHVTLDMGHRLRLGPDIEWIDSFDDRPNPHVAEAFAGAVARYWPGVRARELTPTYAGVRPKIHGPDMASADFVIQGLDEHGVPGLVNLFGIESPGLTSSLAIGEHVAELLAG